MNRRNFIARIVALPFIGSTIGRLFSIKPEIEIRVSGHSKECGYYQLAKLRAFQMRGLERSEGDPIQAMKQRLHAASRPKTQLLAELKAKMLDS
jgi:hypothetical protein